MPTTVAGTPAKSLADPARSIPRGTIGAVSTAFMCYVLLIFGQAGTIDRGSLQYDLNVMQRAVRFPSTIGDR